MYFQSASYRKLFLSTATAALILALGACSSDGGAGQGLSFAASAPEGSQATSGPASDTATNIADGAEANHAGGSVMNPTADNVTDLASSAGGGGGGGTQTPSASGSSTNSGVQRRYSTYNERGSGTVSRLIDDTNMLVSTGNADLDTGVLDPLAPAGPQLDSVLSPVGQVVVADTAVVGAGTPGAAQLVGASALSNGATGGQLASLGLLNTEGVATLSLAGNPVIAPNALPGAPTDSLNGALTQVASVNLGNSNLLGDPTGGASAIGVGLGSNGVAAGTLVSANLGADGALGVTTGGSQLNGGTLGTAPLTGAVGGALGQASSGLGAAGLNGNGILTVAAGNSTIGGGAPLLGVNASAANPTSGTLATVGVLQGNSVAAVSSSALSNLGLGGVTGGANQGVSSIPSAPSGLIGR